MVFYSEGPMFGRSFRCSEGPVFRRSLFRRSYVGTHFHLSVSGIKTFFLSQFISRFFFISFIILLFTFSWDTRE